jgi:hypothetical protein
MIFDFDRYSFLTLGVFSILAMLAAGEIGRRLGAFSRSREQSHNPTLEGAMLGLLALMIAFTFAMALSLFEARRDAILNEANAIGTTALRARLLPAPHDAQVNKLLRDYVQIRVDLFRQESSAADMEAAIKRSNAIHISLWQQVKQVQAVDAGMVPTGLFIQTLNEMIDDQEKRVTAYGNRVPNIVLIALYVIAFVAIAFTGFGAELDSRQSRLPIYVMGILVAVVLLLIQDLDRPGAGLISSNKQPMIDAAAALVDFPE